MTREEIIEQAQRLRDSAAPGWPITSEWTHSFLTLLIDVIEQLPPPSQIEKEEG